MLNKEKSIDGLISELAMIELRIGAIYESEKHDLIKSSESADEIWFIVKSEVCSVREFLTEKQNEILDKSMKKCVLICDKIDSLIEGFRILRERAKTPGRIQSFNRILDLLQCAKDCLSKIQ